METSEIVISCRKKMGLTQKQFGDLLNKEQATIARYESGDITPPGNVILQIQELENQKGNGNES